MEFWRSRSVIRAEDTVGRSRVGRFHPMRRLLSLALSRRKYVDAISEVDKQCQVAFREEPKRNKSGLEELAREAVEDVK